MIEGAITMQDPQLAWFSPELNRTLLCESLSRYKRTPQVTQSFWVAWVTIDTEIKTRTIALHITTQQNTPY